jgi:Fic family protein
VQLNRFINSPIGRLEPIAGHDARRDVSYEHYAFVPASLPTEVPLSQSTYKLLSLADRAIGSLNANIAQLPDSRLLVRPAITREAVSTSALEGTYAAFSEVLEAEYFEDRRGSAEVREVQNYVMAAQRGLELIKTMPICLRLVAELQKMLVAGTRGDSFDSGRLRDRQVYIGEGGRGIEDARFVPCPPGDLLRAGVTDWERWINADDDIPLLVKAAVSHYQFETLHPFSDGNGRIGRLVVTLQLIDAGVLAYPILNLSPWLEPRRQEYISHLLEASATGDLDLWVSFFARAVADRAKAADRTIGELLQARQRILDVLRVDRAKGMVLDLAGDLIGFPRLDVSTTAHRYDVTYQAANAAIKRLVGLGVLREVTGSRYGRVFACDEVYNILERG